MFRETGFLPMVGRKQYVDLFPNVIPSKLNDINSADYKKFDTPFDIAIKVWKNYSGSTNNTSSYYANQKNANNKGTFRSFSITFETSQSNNGKKDLDLAAKTFQKVLQLFTFEGKQLIDFFNP